MYGENFGNDPKKLKVIVGGKEANIISVKNNILYCVVPRMATEGDVEISVYDDNGEEVAFAEAEEKFTYVKQWLVSTLAGQRFENLRKMLFRAKGHSMHVDVKRSYMVFV